jgi:hypothetical protein
MQLKNASTAWAFALAAVALTTAIGALGLGRAGTLINSVVYVASGWAAVHFTRSSVGRAILAFLVAGIVAGGVSFLLVKRAAVAAMAGGPDPVGQAVGSMVAGMVFVGSLLWTFLTGMIGCFIGNATRKPAESV